MFRAALVSAMVLTLLSAFGLSHSRAEAAAPTATFTRTGSAAFAGFTGVTLPTTLPDFGGYPVDSYIHVDEFTGVSTSAAGSVSFSGSNLYVDSYVYNPDRSATLLYCFGFRELADNEFVANQLSSASLDAVVTVTCNPVAGGAQLLVETRLVLNWVPSGGRSSGHFRWRDDDFKGSFSSRGARAAASGVITLNGIEQEAFTPDASIEIFRERGRCFSEGCGFY